MTEYLQICDRLYNLNRIPIMVVNSTCQVLGIWPQALNGFYGPKVLELVLMDFRLQRRDCRHPLISYVEPGFFLGVVELEPDLFAIIGLVSPFAHTRQEILAMCAHAIDLSHLQQFCDMMMQTPMFNLYQMKDFVCILAQLALGQTLSQEDILFSDLSFDGGKDERWLDRELFAQRERADFHVPTDYESAICMAVETGSQELLLKALYAPVQGRVGQMASSALWQEKCQLICLATLVTRAAIRGGLPQEAAFNLSDIYCQRAEVLVDVPSVQKLCYTMVLDFCDKVTTAQGANCHSVAVQKCVDYISIHLHEAIRLDDLSVHCGLCSRSLSIRFKKELGMGIPDYIHQEKVKEAQYMLRHTDLTLSEIASCLNYPSQSYFTQIFKKCCGKTPQQYRKKSDK